VGENKNGSLAGCLACFAAAWIIGWIMIKEDIDTAADMFRITLEAFACCVAEALPFGNDPLITDAGVHRRVRSRAGRLSIVDRIVGRPCDSHYTA
jgi:hypothetical protein